MKYIGEFKDINDIDYEVIIDNHNMDDITEEIVIANKGIVIDYASDGDVFKPVKMSGMTVEVVTDKLLDVFYPGYKVSVTLNRLDKGVDTCIWYGFVTPNIYSQTQYKLDTLAIECVDILSALQDYTYQIPIGERQMRSIRDMVMKCVNQLPYVEDINLIIHTELENLTFDNILLSDTNWYDEDNNPENCEDVMDNIMQFFCSEMFVIGKDIIIKPIAKHFTFDDIDNYVMSDYVNLSMLEMYNKIIVKSSIYAPEYINSWDDDAYVDRKSVV